MNGESSESRWRGRPLSDFTKAELIEIVEELGRLQAAERAEHLRRLDVERQAPTRQPFGTSPFTR